MCTWIAAAAAAAVAGAGMQYKASRDNKAEFKRAMAVQQRADEERQAISRLMRNEDSKLSDKKRGLIQDEAKTVAPTSRQQIADTAEKERTQSNVSALQTANNLGDDSVGMSAQGAHSDTYIKEKAKRTAEHGDKIIKLARLYGANDATGDALQNQSVAALNPRLAQQALDMQRQAMHGSYGYTVEDLNRRAAREGTPDPTVGQGLGAIGGGLMSLGMMGLGSAFGASGRASSQLAGMGQAPQNLGYFKNISGLSNVKFM